MKNVEFVCLGNNGRSPILESVVKTKQESTDGLRNQFEVSSSGLYVIKKHPYEMRLSTMKKALYQPPQFDVFGHHRGSAEFLLKSIEGKDYIQLTVDERAEFEEHFNQVYMMYQNLDVTFRNMALKKKGMFNNGNQDQYPSKQELDIVITATKPLKEEAEKNKPSPHTIVTSLSDITGKDDIKGGFGKLDLTFYDNMIRSLEDQIEPLIQYIMWVTP